MAAEQGETVDHVIAGKKTKGLGVGGRYISHPYYSEKFRELLGCQPYPGTLNIETDTDWRQLAAACIPHVIPEASWQGRGLGAVYAWEATIETSEGPKRAVVIRPLLSRHPPNILEIVACEKLADKIEGDRVTARIRCRKNPDYTRPPRLP